MISIPFSNCYRTFMQTLRRRKKTLVIVLFRPFQVPFMVDYFHMKAYTLFTLLMLLIGFLRYLKALKTTKQIYTWQKQVLPMCLKHMENNFIPIFIKFLELRSKELVRGGHMVLTFLGRSNADPTTDDGCFPMKLLAQSLLCMVKEGLVEESYVNSFNIPHYTPCEDEVRNAIYSEGSFSLDIFGGFQEPLLISHFGNSLDIENKGKGKIAMEVENILHMNVGNGESSYASNSFLQETVIRETLQVLKQSIKGMVNLDVAFNKSFVLADLGCGTGTNTLLLASMVIDTVLELCKEHDRKAPHFQVCLNDLLGNDFNTIFQLLPNFYGNLKKKGENFGSCFVSAIPGSFYGRLFQDESLHLVHASYSVHWLSQVPQGIENNKANIYMAKTSPPNVFEAYGKQFHTDFIKFLQLRSKELVHGGRMVLTFLGRSSVDPTTDDCCRAFDLLARSLLCMVKEGLVEESYVNSFNIPIYTPCEDEVRYAIHNEGSFSLDTFNDFQGNWDPYDTDYTNTVDSDTESHIHGKNYAKVLRAVMEPLLVSHFKSSINIDVLFRIFQEQVAKDLANKKTRRYNIVISLTKR
ncbi:hypothetical protein LXL04_026917 [Taraxacum kok-saghyz]